MTTYLIRRSLQGLIVLVLSTVIIYFLLSQVSGSPIEFSRSIEGPNISGIGIHKRQEQLEAQLGWNKPWYQRYFIWLFDPARVSAQDNPIDVRIGDLRIHGSGFLTGNWGRSIRVATGWTVLELIKSRLPNTLILTSCALLVSLLIAFPIGVLSAIRQYSKLDYAVTVFSFFGLSMPVFWFGLMLIILFAVNFKAWGLPYLPIGGLSDPGLENDLGNRLWHLVLPVTMLSIVSVAGWSRYIRSSMLEVLRQDYVRTAWAKGLQQRVVILKHALPNTLIPLVTIVGLSLPGLVLGSITVEKVFAYPGMGLLYFSALNYDWPLVMGIVIIFATLVILSNILADVLYAAADPRIRYS